MYVLTMLVDDDVISVNHSYHPMAKTLRLAAELIRKAPGAEVCIRRAGTFVAWLKNDWRGDLAEVDIYGPGSRVTPVNPRWLERRAALVS